VPSIIFGVVGLDFSSSSVGGGMDHVFLGGQFEMGAARNILWAS